MHKYVSYAAKGTCIQVRTAVSELTPTPSGCYVTFDSCKKPQFQKC